MTCYRCGAEGHIWTNCPQRFDIRFMTHEEQEEFVQEWALEADKEEVQLRAEVAEAVESQEEGFRRSSE